MIRKTLVGWLTRVCDERTNGFGALTGLVTGMITVFLFDRIYDNPTTGEWMMVAPWSEIPQDFSKTIEYLWLNLVGTIVVVVVGVLLSYAREMKLSSR